jgi:hypothetical protein
MAVLTGSRGIYFVMAAALGVTLIGMVLSGRMAIKRILWIAAGIALSAWLFSTFYGDMLAAMQARSEAAARVEGPIIDRAVDVVFGFIAPMETAPILGYGIGTGTPAMTRFLSAQPFQYGEGELPRNINELGIVLGLAFIAMRFVLATQLVLVALRLAKRGHLAVLPFAGLASVDIAVGQITTSSLSNFLPWFIVGIILACVRADSGQLFQPRGPSEAFTAPHGLRIA